MGGEWIYSEIYANSSAIDYDAGEATAENRGSISAAFTVGARVRVAFWAEIGAWGSSPSPVIQGSVSFSGPGGSLLTRTIASYGGDDGSFYGYLQPGSYSIAGSTRAQLTGTQQGYYYDGPEAASSYLIVYLHAFCNADFDLDDQVDAWDMTLYQQAYSNGDPEADVDGDGTWTRRTSRRSRRRTPRGAEWMRGPRPDRSAPGIAGDSPPGPRGRRSGVAAASIAIGMKVSQPGASRPASPGG